MKRTAIFLFAFVAAASAVMAQPRLSTPIDLSVDATDAHRGIFHAHMVIPASSAQTLVYPKWVPGEHTPSGPITQLAGLHFHSGSSELSWSRDRVDAFAFHVDTPKAAQSVEVDLDYISPTSTFGQEGYGESANATQNLLVVLFNDLILYPAGTASDSVTVHARLKLPDGWGFDTAMPIASRNDHGEIDFAPVSLTTLVDSPVIAGRHFRTIPVADDGREHISIVADSAGATAMSEERIANVRRLVTEADALFGARHYRTYRWLLTLSDLVEAQGLEHHECTDIRQNEHSFTEKDWSARAITVLAHEFVHSWNGKYRRPAGLATADYQQPMIGELLFVYEGMTRYLGDFVLSARSGMRTADEDREFAAWVSANQDRNRPGRTWRPLVDTAAGVHGFSDAPTEGQNYRRALDYYDESLLVWLDADMTIRRLTGGAKSLDDFAKRFFGAPSSAPQVRPYSIDDVVAAFNDVAPFDWRSFILSRVYAVTAHPPLGALEASGWRLVYNSTPNWYQALRARTDKTTDESFSIGIWVKHDGKIVDVVYGSPAFAAGLMPGMKITSIDGRTYDGDVLAEEIRAAAYDTAKRIAITAEQTSFTGTFVIDYHGGQQFPHLERVAGVPDVLSDVMRPHAE